MQAGDQLSCSVLTIKKPSYYKCDNQSYLSVLQLLTINYSVTRFSTREKNDLVKDPFISKREFRDVVFLWSAVDEESVTIVNAGTLKQAYFRLMWKNWWLVPFFFTFYKFHKQMVTNLHCCFNPAHPSGHYMDVSCGQSTAFSKFYDSSWSSSNISSTCSLNLLGWGFFQGKFDINPSLSFPS